MVSGQPEGLGPELWSPENCGQSEPKGSGCSRSHHGFSARVWGLGGGTGGGSWRLGAGVPRSPMPAGGAGVKVSAAAFLGGDGGRWVRVRLDRILRRAARWANGKVWAAVGGGGEVGKLAARFAPTRWCASRPLPGLTLVPRWGLSPCPSASCGVTFPNRTGWVRELAG